MYSPSLSSALRRTALSLLAVLFGVAPSFAQSNRGGIGGNVTDTSGGVVPNAAVTITNLGTGEVRHVNTGGKGDFIQENLDPTTYKIEVEAQGFKKGIIEKVKVDTSTLATADLTLQPGDVATQVTVSAAPPLVNAESGTLSTTITERMLTDTPLANRSVLDLAVTVPNLSGDVGTEDPQVTSQSPAPGFNLSVNGGRAGSTNFLADGVNNTGVGLAREAVAFSPETVSEFSVQTNAYSAEYGRSGGGVISTTTKSGSNEFNGMALWYLRNPVLNAAPYTEAATNRPQSFLRWNQFDGQLGGPVIIPKVYDGRNKTFFFFAGEPRYQSDKLFASANLPTQTMRNGDFSNVVAANGSGTAGGGGWVPQSVYQQFRGAYPGAFNPSTLTTIYNHYNVAGNQLQRNTLATGANYTPFPGNVIPASMLDPVALKLINQYLPPAGNYFIDGNGFIDNYSTYRYVSNDQTRYNIKIDEIPSDKDHVFFRMTKIPETGIKGFDPNYPANGDGAVFSDSQQYMADYTRTFTPTLFNDLRVSYTRGNFSNANSPKYDIFTGENLSTQLGLPSFTQGGLPMFSF
ncbi:MAG: carboxypeptidase regulatory-like domain-containing protein, partial [Candidatus Udaeobacter sp.]